MKCRGARCGNRSRSRKRNEPFRRFLSSVYICRMKLGVIALALSGADAFAVASARPAAVQVHRSAAPSMQFFNPKKNPARDAKGKPKGEFFDDEFDSRGNKVWQPDFADNGERDLATEGAGLYVAFIPFLLFALAYLGGAVGSPYSKGNF
jgi:hypothetical protein